MAVRITVVIIQSAQRDGRVSDLEEQLLTRVMFENNMDAVLVGPIENMDTDGTDALCLSKIPDGSVILGWRPVNDVAVYFQRLGMPWSVTGQPNMKQLRYRQLTIRETSDQVLSELATILKNISVRTLQIALPNSPTPSPVVAAAVPATPAVPAMPSLTMPTLQSTTPPTEQSAIVIQPQVPTAASPTDRDELDQLVDDLEALDL